LAANSFHYNIWLNCWLSFVELDIRSLIDESEREQELL